MSEFIPVERSIAEATLCLYEFCQMESTALDQSTSYVRENLDLHLVNGRCSANLAHELANMYEGRTGNVFAVFDEIAGLEGHPIARPSLTKPPSQFTRPPLRGLWHKHYHQAAFISTNVENHWRANSFAGHVKMAADKMSVPDDKLIGFMLHEYVISGYKDRSRARRLTGEWIVYARQDERNTYLTLGTHSDDDAIYERVLTCTNEFSDLNLMRFVADRAV
jgi:hypothetical protein